MSSGFTSLYLLTVTVDDDTSVVTDFKERIYAEGFMLLNIGIFQKARNVTVSSKTENQYEFAMFTTSISAAANFCNT